MSQFDVDLIVNFIHPDRQARYIALLEGRNRKKMTSRLDHCKDLNMEFAIAIPPKDQNFVKIEMLLRSLGAKEMCYLMSSNPDLDTKQLPLTQALMDTVGLGNGTLIWCGEKLAFYEGENAGNRMIFIKSGV